MQQRRVTVVLAGSPRSPSGGTRYQVALARALGATGLEARRLDLPGPWPLPPPAARLEALERLEDAPGPLLLDGLALAGLHPLPPALARRTVPVLHLPAFLDIPVDPERVRAEARAVATLPGWLAPSTATGRAAALAWGTPRDRWAALPPGRDPLPPVTPPAGARTVLALGNVLPVKDHATLLAAWRRLRAPGWRLEVGGALGRDPALARRLRREAPQGVRFLGRLAGRRLAEAWGRAGVFVSSSRYESWGMALAEAMARGLPVVATEVGGVPELVGGAAILVPPGDPRALANALEDILLDPDRRERLGRAARHRAAALPGWTERAGQAIAFLGRRGLLPPAGAAPGNG